ncbi:MAG: hypothetical protein JWQ38_233 [Flavipsychrobacter sp.]|nr:hypothetical protein [Flavipsychrobacter sp.]
MIIISLTNRHRIVLPLLLALFFTACKKDTKPAEKKTTVYSFSYSGSPYVGNSLHFVSTAPSGSTFAWDFGDTTTSSVAAPGHVYSVAGNYTVSLMVDNDTAHIIKQTLTIGFDSTVMALLTGSRSYRHMYYIYYNGAPYDTTASLMPVTTLAISKVDANTILLGTDTLFFRSLISRTATFGYTYTTMGHATGSYNILTFYADSNKVHYEHLIHISAGSQSKDVFDSP